MLPNADQIKIPFYIAFSPRTREDIRHIIMYALKVQYQSTQFIPLVLPDNQENWVEQVNLFIYNSNDEENWRTEWDKHFNRKENLFASRWMPPILFDAIPKIKFPWQIRSLGAKKRFLAVQILECLFEKDLSVKDRGLPRTLDLIDLFNRQAKNETKKDLKWYQRLAPYPEKDNPDQQFMEKIKENEPLKNLDEAHPLSLQTLRFSIADNYCMDIQKKYKKELRWLFILSFAVGLCSQIYGGISHIYANFPFTICGLHFSMIELTLPLYVLFFGGLLAYYLWCVKRNNNDDKFVEFRLLAEALRVQCYWTLAGIKNDKGAVADVADYVLHINIAQVEGASIALHNWRKKDKEKQTSFKNIETVKIIDAVKTGWIGGQIEYYKTAIQKREKYRKIGKNIGLFCYVFSVLLALIYCVVTLREKLNGLPEKTYDLLTCFPWSLSDGMWLGIGPFIFAMIGYLIEKKGWEEEIESFKQSAKMFETIKNELNGADDGKSNALLLVLGKEALKEHESWLKLHRNRKPTPNY